MSNADQLEMIVRLLLAIGLGAVIGLQRDYRGQAAGVRTSALVCLGAALFGEIGTISGDSRIAAGAVGPPIVAATHGLFVGRAWERLQRSGVEAVFVTDSLPQSESGELPLEVVSLAGLIGDRVRVLHGAVVTG
jgi:MgtC family protein